MTIPFKRSAILSISYKMEKDPLRLPTATIDSLPSQPTIIDNNKKKVKIQQRQAPVTNSIVHITITEAGTVIYTQTATSYSYIPSYSTIPPGASSSSSSNNGINNGNNSSSSDGGSNGKSGINLGAIIGGVVGGVAFIALIGLGFFLMRKRKRTKRVLELQQGGYIDDNDSYYRGVNRHSSSGAAPPVMTSSMPSPRQLVAPMAGLHLAADNREGDGRDSKYYLHDGGGYYEDTTMVSPIYAPYYSNSNSVAASDSSPSTTVENNGYSSPTFATFNNRGRHVPNEVDNSTTTTNNYNNVPVAAAAEKEKEERHVPHLKETMEEPPHSKD